MKHRPSYPREVLSLLQAECGLRRSAVVADIGSGTGKLAELFLENGNPVFGVEPNREMRSAAERLLAGYPHFHSVAGRAEATALKDRSVDFVVAGQAFHWFDGGQARQEFQRILRPDGWVALTWNARRSGGSPFLEAYERALLRYAIDYESVDHKNFDGESIRLILGLDPFHARSFHNRQVFDLRGLIGRTFSSSYTPGPDHPNHEPLRETLAQMFKEHESGGTVSFVYDTLVYFGQFPAD